MNTLYRGSVKDLLGPTTVNGKNALVFEYTDAYSVFDWGRMPDALPGKGSALALIAADWFEKLEKPESWKEFSPLPQANALRRGNRHGSSFIEMGENLQSTGLRTHCIGALESVTEPLKPRSISQISKPIRHLAVQSVSVIRPTEGKVLGRAVMDYAPTRASPFPRLIPLEVVFRFSAPPGSSLFERVAKDPGYLKSIGSQEHFLEHSQDGNATKCKDNWDFPVLELFTKLEPTDRVLSLSEALAISGLSPEQLQKMLFQTAWVAGWLRAVCARAGIELADGKLEWSIDHQGQIILVDAIGPDELRLLKDGIQLSKEFLRAHYRRTPWYEAVNRAKVHAAAQGTSDWKKSVTEPPPALPAPVRELASQLYQALANELTGRKWFEGAWPLDRVANLIAQMARENERG